MKQMMLTAVCLIAGAAGAATDYWNVTTGGDFAEPSNWDTATYPAATDTVVLRYAQSAAITMTNDFTTSGQIQYADGFKGTIDAGGNTLRSTSYQMFRRGSVVTLTNGVFKGTLNGEDQSTGGTLVGAKVTVAGPETQTQGSLQVAQSASWSNVFVYAGGASHVGSLLIGGNAARPSSGTQILGGSTATFTGDGTLLAVTNGGTFTVGSKGSPDSLLVITNGAKAWVRNASPIIGSDATNTNSTLRIVAGGTMSVENQSGSWRGMQVGANGYNARLEIDGGSFYSTNYDFWVGGSAAASQAAIVVNDGLFDMSGYSMYIGYVATNTGFYATNSTLNLNSVSVGRNGAKTTFETIDTKTTVSSGFSIGTIAIEGDNSVLVSGSGSVFDARGSASYVGQSGSCNAMIVSNGATAFFGFAATNGTGGVIGGGLFIVGNAATAASNRFLVTDGAKVVVTNGYGYNPSFGGIPLGVTAGADGNIVEVNNGGTLFLHSAPKASGENIETGGFIGYKSNGNALKINGGTVTATRMKTVIGPYNTSNNVISVTGGGSFIPGSHIIIGEGGTGFGNELFVSNGIVQITSLAVGTSAGSQGNMLRIGGTNSQVLVTAYNFTVGYADGTATSKLVFEIPEGAEVSNPYVTVASGSVTIYSGTTIKASYSGKSPDTVQRVVLVKGKNAAAQAANATWDLGDGLTADLSVSDEIAVRVAKVGLVILVL